MSDMETNGLMKRLDEVLPMIRARREEIERERCLPRDISRAVRDTGVCTLEVPRPLGGLEATPLQVLQAIELVSRADGATGWCTAQAIANNGVVGFMEDPGAREVFADPTTPSAGIFAPAGRAQRVDGGVRVSGRWQFASGVTHAEWLFAGCVVMEGESPHISSKSSMASSRGSSARAGQPRSKGSSMKKERGRHREPSAASLREIPEVDFSKADKSERGYYYKKMLADGGYWAGPEGDLRWYPVGKGGRPKKDSGVEPSSPHSVRLPDSLWEQLGKEAKKAGVKRHALLRKFIVDGLARPEPAKERAGRRRGSKVA